MLRMLVRRAASIPPELLRGRYLDKMAKWVGWMNGGLDPMHNEVWFCFAPLPAGHGIGGDDALTINGLVGGGHSGGN